MTLPINRRSSHRPGRRQLDRTGFTLIELLLVLAILVVLASMAVTFFGGTQERALQDAAKGQVGIFKSAVNLYKFHTKQYPDSLENLIKSPGDSQLAQRWSGPYIDASSVPLDPWDRPYKFAAPGKRNPESFDVWSVGPDGQDGSDDDIGNW